MIKIRRIMVAALCCMAMMVSAMTEAADKIVFIPQDNRPISDEQTVDTIKQLGYEVIVPPDELLGSRDNLGNPDKLWNWLEESTTVPKKKKKPPYKTIPGIKAVVLSGDSMIYGSLVGSRKHSITQEKLMERVARFQEFKDNHPDVKLYVFSSIMRTPRTGEAAGTEEPSYYLSYGADIFRYTALKDKDEMEGLTKREKKEIKFLEDLIPPAAIDDWMSRRTKNFAVNKAMIDLAKKDVFSYFCLGRDDNAPYSQTHKESRYLTAYGKSLGRTKFNNMAGIDEFGMLLLTRAVHDIEHTMPFVYVKYNWGEGPDVVPSFSDEAIDKTIRSHIIMAGGMYVTIPDRADLVLLVNTNPGGETFEANWADNDRKPKAGSTYFANMVAEELKHGKAVGVADIAYANGSDNALMEILKEKKLLFRLNAYSGWNTATNSTGFVLGQGMLSIQMTPESRKRLLYTRLLDDWAYQANVRQIVAEKLPYLPGEGDYGSLNGKTEAAAQYAERFMQNFAGFNLPAFVDVNTIKVSFPWKRMFECRVKF